MIGERISPSIPLHLPLLPSVLGSDPAVLFPISYELFEAHCKGGYIIAGSSLPVELLVIFIFALPKPIHLALLSPEGFSDTSLFLLTLTRSRREGGSSNIAYVNICAGSFVVPIIFLFVYILF